MLKGTRRVEREAVDEGHDVAVDELVGLEIGTDDEPLYRQIYARIRDRIISGRLAPGSRLPSTRDLAAELGCSRNTVLNAYEQLFAEGYTTAAYGGGTRVSDELPDQPAEEAAALTPSSVARSSERPQQASNLLGVLSSVPIHPELRLFDPGLPAVDQFPFATWAKLYADVWREPEPRLLRCVDPLGLPELREAIAAYVRAARGVLCTADNVVVTSGTTQSIDLIMRLLLARGEKVWVEEPGVPSVPAVVRLNGGGPVPVGVDTEGLDVDAGERLAPQARIVVVTPSHQYPLGCAMSLARRLQLLQWAQRTGAWIVEDDYDGEFRYQGRPLASLQSLDTSGLVLYVGTFSKILFPGLRVGYVVLPQVLIDLFRAARYATDFLTGMPTQAVRVRFIAEGHLGTHVRRMRRQYGERQAAFVDALHRELGDRLGAVAHPAGLHVVARLAPDAARGTTDAELADRAADAGYTVRPLSGFYSNRRSAQQGLLLGYASVPARAAPVQARALRHALFGR